LDKISIAVDGPAGAGKSTIAKIISKHFGIIYLDTGAMYRAVAYKAIQEGIDTKDSVKLAQLMKNINIDIKYIGDEQRIIVDGEDVSSKIRTPDVTIGSSNVAVIPEVRIKMVGLQRKIALENSVVMDGRDIGTYVLPDALVKIYLTASLDERAERRYKEQLEKGMKGFSLEDVKNDIKYRDLNDSSRAFAPLSKANDALEIDSTGLSVKSLTDKIITIIESKLLQ
jgi:cytidylate kinase